MSSAIVHIPGKPRISQGLKSDAVLRRYLDAAKFFDFLQNQTLFFCRGDKFEDKFEGAFTDSVKQAIESSYDKNKIAFTYDEFRKRLRERVFINCWHKSSDDSMAMWSIYGKSSCSVAITTTVEKLKQAIEQENLPHEISIEKVEYVRHWHNPALDIAPYSRVFAYKTKAYEFEKEIRVIVDRFHTDFDTSISETGIPIRIQAQTLLRSVVIAPEAPTWFEQLVRDACIKYGVTAPVRRSMLSKDPI